MLPDASTVLGAMPPVETGRNSGQALVPGQLGPPAGSPAAATIEKLWIVTLAVQVL